MKNPAGIECSFFYGDYYRGRNHEECRMLGSIWFPKLCTTCPVPAIGRANSCKALVLRGRISRPLHAVFQKRVQVDTFCEKTSRAGFDPHIGCGECHPLPPVFEVKK